jgi:hypothetical protein
MLSFANNGMLRGVHPATFADDLTVLRRLSLALFGTVPSLEDVRRFEADEQPRSN